MCARLTTEHNAPFHTKLILPDDQTQNERPYESKLGSVEAAFLRESKETTISVMSPVCVSRYRLPNPQNYFSDKIRFM
jgi:hypothetical protein